MFGLAQELKALESSGRTVRAGLVGAGQMGTDIVSQVSLTPALRIAVIADLDPLRAVEAYRIAGYAPERVILADTQETIELSASNGHFAAATDYRMITDARSVDAVIESTGSPEAAARTSIRAIRQGKHLVTMSVEMDVTVGPLLKWYADRHDVVYTVAAGDEPTALFELFDFATALGLEVVAAGKGKNNPLNRDATPDELAGEAARRGLTPEMLVEFVDGSKTMIEMASVANATGLVPDVRGMHGPRVNIADFKTTFARKDRGGLLSRHGVVDYVIGDLAPGVFLVFTTDKPRLREALVLRDMGHGPNYVLLRPFHLCSIEVSLSVLLAVLHRKATMAPGPELVAEVLTVAKCDLPAGTALERIGGRTHYGMADTAGAAAAEDALPLGLAKGAVLRRALPKGAVVGYGDVELPSDSVVTRLRRLQDAWREGSLNEGALLQAIDEMAGG
jgi:predicted homoserine dehydrogenase-like protein